MPPLVSVRNDVSEEQTRHKFHTGVSCWPDQGSAFDWLKRIFLEARSIRSSTRFSGSTAEAFLMDTVTLYKLGSYQNCPQ